MSAARMLWLMLTGFAVAYWRAYRWMGVLWVAVLAFWWSVLAAAIAVSGGAP